VNGERARERERESNENEKNNPTTFDISYGPLFSRSQNVFNESRFIE
jgi:hypothetical protein